MGQLLLGAAPVFFSEVFCVALKDKILARLSSGGEYISGEELAKEYGVSRAAVWKAVRALKESGCMIDSVTNKGYRLLSPADTLSADEIRSRLAETAAELEVIVLESVDSTNSEAKRMLANGFSGSALIAANEQTGGRGRLGRSFYSPKNTGVYMSFLLHTDLKLADAVRVTTAASVAVVKALKSVSGIEAEIKWVNDVYVDGRKVCGILTEAVSDFETATAKSVIIGIGINTSTIDFPDDIKDRASSLGASEPIRNALIAATANELTALCEDLSDGAFIDFYRAHSMIIGRSIEFYANNERRTGKALDIDSSGALIVLLPDGRKTALSSGEVTVRLNSDQSI